MITDVTLYKEIFSILKTGENTIGRIKDSLDFYKQSEKYYAGLKREKLIQENGEGIIYCYWYNFTPLAIVNHKEYRKYHIITRTHGYELYDIRNNFGRQPFKMIMDKRLERVVFACEYAKEYYLKRYNLSDSEKYPVCALGTLDNSVINGKPAGNETEINIIDGPDSGSGSDLYNSENSTSGKQYTVVSCSDVVPLKRVDLIAKGLSEINDINVRWIHFGQGKDFEKVKALIKDLLGDKGNISVELKGRVKNEVLHQFYNDNHVDLFITTTYSEGGNPVSIMEAMSHSIPIVATSVCNIPKMIDGNGVVISENPSGEEIAAKVKKILLMDSDENNEMRKKSRMLWEEKYNSDNNSDSFIKDVLMQL